MSPRVTSWLTSEARTASAICSPAGNFTQQRLFADLSRIAGVPSPPVRMQGRFALAGVETMELIGLRSAQRPQTRSAPERSGSRIGTTRRANSSAGSRGPHEETLEDTVRWQLEELGKRAEGHRLTDLALRTTGGALRLLPFS